MSWCLSEVMKNAKDAYKAADEAAQKMKATNPIKLGLALNFSVFYYEILNLPEEACHLAKVVCFSPNVIHILCVSS